MPEYQDLVNELHLAGVSISSLDKLTQTVERSDDWVAAFSEMALTGRRQGVTLTRQGKASTDANLQRILSGYPFTREQTAAVIQNVAAIQGG
jgi:hypothetical protein